MAQVESHREAFQSAGLQVVAVGLGEPKHALRYCGRLAPSIKCVVSETIGLHVQYGVRHSSGMGELVSSIAPSLRIMRSGHLQGAPTGDQRMKHATLIIDQAGVVMWSQYADFVGDHPDLDQLLADYRTFSS